MILIFNNLAEVLQAGHQVHEDGNEIVFEVAWINGWGGEEEGLGVAWELVRVVLVRRDPGVWSIGLCVETRISHKQLQKQHNEILRFLSSFSPE